MVDHDLEAHFSRKLRKVLGKYKGKFPFKCFNCGKVGHFASKCPYNSHDEVDDEKEKSSKKKFYKKKNVFKKKKILIASVSDSESSSFECDENEVLFMAIETTCQESNSDNDVELVEADLECEFLYALKKIKELKRNLSVQENQFLKEKENFEKETKELN